LGVDDRLDGRIASQNSLTPGGHQHLGVGVQALPRGCGGPTLVGRVGADFGPVLGQPALVAADQVDCSAQAKSSNGGHGQAGARGLVAHEDDAAVVTTRLWNAVRADGVESPVEDVTSITTAPAGSPPNLRLKCVMYRVAKAVSSAVPTVAGSHHT
jgi:hypothetical protein